MKSCIAKTSDLIFHDGIYLNINAGSTYYYKIIETFIGHVYIIFDANCPTFGYGISKELFDELFV